MLLVLMLWGSYSAGDYLHHDVAEMGGAGHIELPAAEMSNLEEISKVGGSSMRGACCSINSSMHSTHPSPSGDCTSPFSQMFLISNRAEQFLLVYGRKCTSVGGCICVFCKRAAPLTDEEGSCPVCLAVCAGPGSRSPHAA